MDRSTQTYRALVKQDKNPNVSVLLSLPSHTSHSTLNLEEVKH